MSIKHRICVTSLGILLPLLLAGCSGKKDTPAATPTAQAASSSSPAAGTEQSSTPLATPSTDLTPDAKLSPLGGTPATAEEIEIYNRKQEAKDLALNQNFDKAIPLFEQLHSELPDDVEVTFYLLICYGTTEKEPNKKSKAYEYAQAILKTSPNSREAEKANSYINSANFSLPPGFKYGPNSMDVMGEWVIEEDASFKAKIDIPLHTSLSTRLGPAEQAILWESEASPANSDAEKLPKGTTVKVTKFKEFLYGLNSWRKAIPAKTTAYDTSMFSVSAVYIEVTSDGPIKGTKGWIVNESDRYLGEPEKEWGVWIDNRLGIPRQSEVTNEEP